MSQSTPSKKAFFLPEATDSELAKRVYTTIREFVAKVGGDISLTERRIYRLEFHDNEKGRIAVATVGEMYDRETVIAIFESSSLYFICTQNHGVLHSGPYFVGSHDVIAVEEFA